MTDEGKTAPLSATPVTPAGVQLGSFLRALNSNDVVTLRSYIDSHFSMMAKELEPVETRMNQYRRLMKLTGGLTISRVEWAVDDFEITVTTQATNDASIYRLFMKVEEDKPYKVLEFMFEHVLT